MYHVREQENSERVHTIIICKKFSSRWALIILCCYTRPVQTNWRNNFQYETFFKSSFIMQFSLKWNLWSPETISRLEIWRSAPQLRVLTGVLWTANGAFPKLNADMNRSCDRHVNVSLLNYLWRAETAWRFQIYPGFQIVWTVRYFFFRSKNISVDRLGFTFRTCRYC